MKKIIAVLLSFVLVLSFTACGNDNILEFKAHTLHTEERVSGESLSDIKFEAEVKVDLEKLSLEYTDEIGTYFATLEAIEDKSSGDWYRVDWKEPPVRKGIPHFDKGFDVILSYLRILSEKEDNVSAVLQLYLYNEAYVDYISMILMDWK